MSCSLGFMVSILLRKIKEEPLNKYRKSFLQIRFDPSDFYIPVISYIVIAVKDVGIFSTTVLATLITSFPACKKYVNDLLTKINIIYHLHRQSTLRNRIHEIFF